MKKPKVSVTFQPHRSYSCNYDDTLLFPSWSSSESRRDFFMCRVGGGGVENAFYCVFDMECILFNKVKT